MPAYEVLTGRVVNPGAAFTLLTANTGDAFSVKDFNEPAKAVLEGVWTMQATAGQVRVRSQRLHDDVQGIRLVANAAACRNLFNDVEEQKLFPNDPLRFDMTGGGAETDAAALLVYYEQLGGVAQRLETWEGVKPRIIDIMGLVVDVAGPATSGDWSAGTLINATVDTLKADNDYACLGYECNTESLAVALKGTDTGNLRVGGPGGLEAIETRDWFVRMSRNHGTPHIPIINSNNRGSTLAHVARVGAGGTISVTFHMARLAR